VPTNVGAPPPPVTRAGIQRLIERLRKDLEDVRLSRKSNQALKDDIASRIMGLTREGQPNQPNGLLVMARDNFPAILWDPIATEFANLTPLLLSATDQGACNYRVNGTPACIVTTRTQCDELGGTFSPGQDCS
jgi:hypothetical protein